MAESALYFNGTRVATATEWSLTANRDYVDATVFGNTNRTYLIPMPGWTLTYTDGDQETTMNLPIGTTAETTRNEGTGDITIRFNTRGLFTGVVTTSTTNTTNGGFVVPNAVQERIDTYVREAGFLNARWFTYPADDEYRTDPLFGRPSKLTEADKRATELLKSKLNKKQLEMLETSRKFQVKGKNLTYQIHINGSVETVTPHGWFCVHPIGPVRWELPRADEAMAYKLLIESDEKEFLRIANWSGRDGDNWIDLGRMDISGHAKQTRMSERIYGARQTPRQRIAAAIGV